MDKKRLEEDIVALVFSLFFFAFMYFFISPNLTGLVIYEPTSTYNVSEVNLTNGFSIKAIENTTTTSITTVYSLSLINATLDGADILSEVIALDGDEEKVKSDEIFNVTFNSSLSNNDKVMFKTDDGAGEYVYLCHENCSYPGFGFVNITGEGIYQITINGLGSSTTSFRIKTSNDIKFNHVNATNTITISNTTTSYDYPTYPIEIVTEDIEPANLSSFDLFMRNDSLNNQNITYYYSIDSGINWIDLPDDNNLTGINSTRIKIKAIMQSDGIVTPYIYGLNINYTELISNYTGNGTNTTQNNSTNSTNSTESNSTNSTGSGSGGSTSSSGPAPAQSSGISNRERAARTAAASLSAAPSAPASNPAPNTPTQSASQPITGRVTGTTGQAIKVEDKFTKENSIVSKVIIGSIALLILITIVLTIYEYKKRKALKGQIKK